MSQRRYLVLTELFMPTKGGTAVWFDEVYRRLGDRHTHIVTAAVPHDRAHDNTHANTVHRLKLQRHAWLRPASLPIYARLFLRALKLGLRHDFHGVHAGRVLPEGLVAWGVARLIRRPLVIYAHGEEITTWRRSPRRLRAMRFAYRHADRVIANSEFTRGQLIGLGVAPQRIDIIHPGVDLERFHPRHETQDLRARLGLEPGQKLILSVGRLSPRKGFDQVIRALAALVDEGLDAQYAIIGIGQDAERLQRLAQECGVSERVNLLGHVTPEDLPRWYCAADVFAMPNREIDGDTEGFGMVFLEAAACGCPAIAGDAGGTGAAILDGETGFRVEGSQVSAVADALRIVLTDPARAGALRDAARTRAVQAFSWEEVARQTDSLQSRLSDDDAAVPTAQRRGTR